MSKRIVGYESDAGTVHPLRVDLDTEAGSTGNPVANTAVNSKIKAKVSKTNREFGLRPRGAMLRHDISFNSNGVDYVYSKYRFLPIFQKATYDGSAFNEGAQVISKGETWVVVSQIPEDY